MHSLVVQREEEPCLGRLAVVWGGYGVAVALLSQAFHNLPLGGALAWVVAGLGAVCLMLCWGEF